MKMRFSLFLLFILASVTYAMEVRVPLSKLVEESDRIVRGRVTHLISYQGTNEFGDELIFTDVHIQNNEAMKGDRSNFSVTVEGGTVNGIRLEVSTQPRFKMGEEVIVFVRKQTAKNVPVAGTLSRYTVSRGGLIQENKLSYREFRRQILEEVEKGRVRR